MDEISGGHLSRDAVTVTLCSATDGNRGRSLAWGCKRFGAACKIYIHAEVSEARAQVMRDFGADVIRVAGNYDASVAWPPRMPMPTVGSWSPMPPGQATASRPWTLWQAGA